MYFFYGKDEKAYKSCYNGVKKAYPSANYKVVAGYGHLTYSIKNTADYIDRIKSVCEGNIPQDHIFLRKGTIATGGKVCDCTYISKDIALKEEFQEYENER